mgnify:CR=1 FL=1
MIRPAVITFQLPLSGSLVFQTAGDDEDEEDELSTPSLGITGNTVDLHIGQSIAFQLPLSGSLAILAPDARVDN